MSHCFILLRACMCPVEEKEQLSIKQIDRTKVTQCLPGLHLRIQFLSEACCGCTHHTIVTHHIKLKRPHHCPDQGSDIQEMRVDEVGQLQYEQIHYELLKNDIIWRKEIVTYQ